MKLDAEFVQQLAFIKEIDQLKSVLRKTSLVQAERVENSAEHSWQVAFMAVFLQEYAEEEIDICRVIKMLLVHDVVEIDAGDTFVYDNYREAEKEELEKAAARRIFGLLPKDQGDYLMALWHEFESEETPEAKFAMALDRLQPVLHNYFNQGGNWSQFGITRQQVESVNKKIENGSGKLWQQVEIILDEAEEKGYFSPK